MKTQSVSITLPWPLMAVFLACVLGIAVLAVGGCSTSQNVVYKDENGTVITKEQFDAIANKPVIVIPPQPLNATPNATVNATQNWTLTNVTNATNLTASNWSNVSLKSGNCTWKLPDPDWKCTPGDSMDVIDPRVICAVNYTDAVRNVSEKTKEKVYAMYNITNHTTGEYEIDHLIPLGLGGSNDITNLWPQPATPTPGYKQKDVVENALRRLVCTNKTMDFAVAQYEIVHNWTAYVR